MSEHLFSSEMGMLNYKICNNVKKIGLFVIHGGNTNTQNIDYWTPVSHIIEKYYFPIYIDSPGHGKSYFTDGIDNSLQNKVIFIKQFINNFIENSKLDKFYILARSLGGAITISMLPELKKIKRVGLIAPAGIPQLISELQSWSGELLNILHDEQDPIINIESLKHLEGISQRKEFYIIGEKRFKFSVNWKKTSAASHTPELFYPNFFEQFLINLNEEFL